VLFYGAYGSNTDPERFARYTAGTRSPEELRARSRWLTVDRPIYFAGTSRTWGGAVAFLSAATSPSSRTPVRAYEVTSDELVTLIRAENGYPDTLPRGLEGALHTPDGLATLPFALSDDGYQGKYNVLMRLADIEGHPCFALSTSRRLPLGVPSAAYRAVMARGLADAPSTSPIPRASADR
jgi:hypothetical protein